MSKKGQNKYQDLKKACAARKRHDEMYPNKKSKTLRDFPHMGPSGYHRNAVCKRCHCVMHDCEPAFYYGEFWHPSKDKEGKPHWCRNAGKKFTTQDLELEPFIPKSVRRRYKRIGVRP